MMFRFLPPIASALVNSVIRKPYNRRQWRGDVMAGLTVGIVAIPLSMALSIAIGLPPQHGLFTALIAGFVIALLGGSRLSVSGPTAAFIVVLHPIVLTYGLSGLMLATLMAGVMLIGMSAARFGRLIEYIPSSVVLGFTLGIAIVIATLQVPDSFGLVITDPPEFYLARLWLFIQAMPQVHGPTVVVTAATLLVLIFWRMLNTPVPPHLPALLVGVGLAMLFERMNMPVDTLASRFQYALPDGTTGSGIPPLLPSFSWPWADGLGWSFGLARELLPFAFAIAMLGAIESLLCAVVMDNMSGQRHDPNGELFGQGVGNILVPFFGGITATAALARSATSYRAGATTPIAGMVHALVVGAGLLWFAPWLGYLPMASMAALLLMVAWHMSERHHVFSMLKRAPRGDILVLVLCATLTVLVDMVVAIFTGVVIAALLFIQQISAMTRVQDVSTHPKHAPRGLPEGWVIFKITGPLFFAAADRVFTELIALSEGKRGVILYMDGVSVMDAGGLDGLSRYRAQCRDRGVFLTVADVQFQPLKAMVKAGVQPVEGEFLLTSTLAEAVEQAG